MDQHLILALLHVFLIAPFFIYIGVQRAAIPEWLFKVLIALGLVIILYHAYRAYAKYKAGNSMLWVNIIHAFYVGPLLIWIGVKEKDAPRSAYEMLLLVAFAALGYHGYNAVLMLSTATGDRD
jgi:hypothetical protein